MRVAYIDVDASFPAGTSLAQFREMQRNLLEERFRLAFHWEPREARIYELTVIPEGIKMRASGPGASAPEREWSVVRPIKSGRDRYPAFPEGRSGLMGLNGYVRWRSSNVAMAILTFRT